MATKHRLRRSCAFCRARKIKCSNETICEACRRQGADCIYDFEPPRPKARSSLDGTPRSESLNLRNDLAAPLMGRQRSSTTSSVKDSPIPMGPMVEEPFLTDDVEDVATVLDRTFFENFAGSKPSGKRMPNGMVSNLGQSQVKYSGLLSLLSHDLVGLSSNQYSSLGSSHVEDGAATFFLSGLDLDETPAMFDNSPAMSTNPVTEYGQRQQTQLIDVWYSSHPLSFLVSKTLLLRELRDGTHDEVLLAAMLADANFTIGGEPANTRGRALLQYAQAQLRHRPLQTTQNSGVVTDSGTVVYSGISTRIFSGISTVQALMLLGWNALGESQFRRAITYIQLAGRLATDLKSQVIATDGMQLSSRINGIDVYDVEKELIDYLYWTTYSISLWVYEQTGRNHFSASPAVLNSIFIPSAEDTSSAIQLDLVSENVSTIQKQKAAIREVWPVAHVAISAAHICGFHPQQQGSTTSNPAQRCRDSNRFLIENIKALNKQGANMTSISFVLITYHTLAMQLLFPAMQPQDCIKPDVVDRLCYSMEEILQIFAVLSNQPKEPLGTAETLHAPLSAAFGLALDTCSRALRVVQSSTQFASIEAQSGPVQAFSQTLQAMASRMYLMSKSDFLDQRSGLRAVRKQLKASMKGLPSSRSSSSGEVPPLSPTQRSSATLSPGSSDHLSTATTPEMDSQATFVSPKDTRIPSPETANNLFQAAPNMAKQEWHGVATTMAAAAPNTAAPGDLMCNPMDPNALGIQSREDLSLSGLVDLQPAWLPQGPPLMDVDMSGVQWDWTAQGLKQEATVPPAAVWSDMDMVL